MKPLVSVRAIVVLALLLACFVNAADPRVLVYTRNGKGYVHDNIAASAAALVELGRQNGFTADVSSNATAFTATNLSRYAAVIFCNSNNEAFETDDQRDVFKRYIQSGGGFVGIHSASGSERKWPYFWSVLGGKFTRHAPLQKFTLNVIDARHPATAHLPAAWEWTDECYYVDHMNPRVHVLLTADLGTLNDPPKEKYPGKVFGDQFPLAWCQEYDGGRQFYTALGHKIEHYSDPNFLRHLLGGIQWVLRQKP